MKVLEDYDLSAPGVRGGPGDRSAVAMDGEVVPPTSHAEAVNAGMRGGVSDPPRAPMLGARRLSATELDDLEAVAGSSVVSDPVKLAVLVSTIDAVREQSIRGLKAAVQIGREMNTLKATLSFPEFQRLKRGSRKLFSNWSSGNLSKAMAAAEFVDRKWVAGNLLPMSYTVLYQLSLIDEAEIRTAVERQLITPHTSREDAMAIRAGVLIGVPSDSVEDANSTQVGRDLPDHIRKFDDDILKARARLRRLVADRKKAFADYMRNGPTSTGRIGRIPRLATEHRRRR